MHHEQENWTQVDKKEHVEEHAGIFEKVFSEHEQMRHVQDSWGLSVQHTQKYIRKAGDLVRDHHVDVDRQHMPAAKVKELEKIARDRIA